MAFRDEILEELRKLEVDVEYTEKSHFAAAELLQVVHYLLGGVAALLSAAASASIVKSNSTLGAILALLAALAAALLTFVKPETVAQRHLTCGRQLGDLKRRLYQCRRLDGNADSGVSDENLRAKVAEFTAEKRDCHEGAPTIGPIAFARARRKVEAGHFDHGSA